MSTSGLGTFDLMNMFTGSREVCFFESEKTADLSAICHEARSVEVSQGEDIYVTFVDINRKSSETLTRLGKACHIRQAEVTTTLLVRVWAARVERGDVPVGSGGSDDSMVASLGSTAPSPNALKGQPRLCGELRVPLRRLGAQFHNMLYQSWVTLDPPGLLDSEASVGFGDDGAALDQKLRDGPRQLHQPRICLSICRTSELSTNQKLMLSFDAHPEARVSQWAPLLLSQQQHYVMSKALHNQFTANADGGRPVGPDDLQELQRRQRQQGEALEEARRELAEAERRMQQQEGETANNCPIDVTEEMDMSRRAVVEQRLQEADRLRNQVASQCDGGGFGAAQDLEAKVRQLRADNALKQQESEGLRSELDNVREEANSKIDAANERIRLLRRDRDEARQKGKRLDEESQTLNEENNDYMMELDSLREQKEVLLTILEDLHQTCRKNGLKNDARDSIDSIKASIQANFQSFT